MSRRRLQSSFDSRLLVSEVYPQYMRSVHILASRSVILNLLKQEFLALCQRDHRTEASREELLVLSLINKSILKVSADFSVSPVIFFDVIWCSELEEDPLLQYLNSIWCSRLENNLHFFWPSQLLQFSRLLIIIPLKYFGNTFL